jgi:threonyl-tRNA synthetase
MVVVGPKEAETQSVNVRIRGTNESKSLSAQQFIAAMKEKVKSRVADLAL